MARINRDGLPVIAAEGEHRHERFDAMLRAKAVTYLQFCLGLCGGFGGGARLDAMAAAFGIATTPQCFSTAILQAASLHFGAARGNVGSVEFHRFHDHLAALLPAPMRTCRPRPTFASTIRRDSDSGRSQPARNPAAAKSSCTRSSAQH